jgi:hypothetical protein
MFPTVALDTVMPLVRNLFRFLISIRSRLFEMMMMMMMVRHKNGRILINQQVHRQMM